MSRKYITTAIDYPNAAPHMGHVLEKVLADVIARWWRSKGDEVRFQIGTDEHGIKIQQTAAREKVTPEQLVDRNVPLFEDVYRRLGISADVFVRTSDRATSWPGNPPFKHRPTVEALWRKLRDAGALEKRTYKGLYCPGCERFVTKKDLVDGKCPDHNIPPEEVEEENWFFLLSRESVWLKNLLKSDYTIVPAFRAPETMMLLEQGLEDVSFSRPTASLAWGIPVPDEAGQTLYVWCDALTNYISTLGLLTDREDRLFWDDAEVTHVIGKDIARFHALIWPAMLKNAGIRTPDRLLIHGFVTNEGRKMSKSLGNVVDPTDIVEKFGGDPDPLRFFLMHEIPVGNDGDFSWKRLEEMYDAKLRNQLGNLLQRVLVLMNKDGGSIRIPESATDAERAEDGWKQFAAKMDVFDLHGGIQQAFELVATLNVGFDHAKPWVLQGEAKSTLLARFAESLRHVALLLLPFMSGTAQRISTQLNVSYAERMLEKDFVITEAMKQWGGAGEWTKVGGPEILFKPLEK